MFGCCDDSENQIDKLLVQLRHANNIIIQLLPDELGETEDVYLRKMQYVRELAEKYSDKFLKPVKKE